jgi:hypothetical protein
VALSVGRMKQYRQLRILSGFWAVFEFYVKKAKSETKIARNKENFTM